MSEHPTVADALWRALEMHGADLVFGHPGGAILPVYDALHRRGRPRHVLVRHEQAAAHAADGFARATGRPGVCLTTSGPGATNLVTGLATAFMDSVPVVAITGQVPTGVQGTDAFQETDIVGVTMPVTKHGYLLDDPGDLCEVVGEAFRLARSGRPGPVLIDMPKDVQNAPFPGTVRPSTPTAPAPEAAPDPERVARAARLIDAAERPLIMAGRGVVLAEATAALRELAERADLPVVTTLLGLDGFPGAHPLALGLPGMHGTERANRAIQRADVILGLGLRFDDRVTGPTDTFAPDATIIHADIAPTSIGKRIEPAVRLVGDLRDTLPALAARVAAVEREQWRATVAQWARDAEPADAVEPWADAHGPLSGRRAARELARRIRRTDAAVATDVGQHQMWLAQELRDAAPGSHFTSGGLGTMGYALPAALGAALGRPDRPTWAVAGDGGFQMTLQELATIVAERVPLRIAVFNNGVLGMVRQWQEIVYERRYAESTLACPDLVRLAGAYGIPGLTLERAESLAPALDWADAQSGPVLLDLRLDPDENVYPMVPPGAAVDEAIGDAPERAAI